MSISGRASRNGYYDDNGRWQKTKHCLVLCGTSCNCGPPGGQYYSEQHDKTLIIKAIEKTADEESENKCGS